MANTRGKYVDLAALSLSGSLVPSVPTKLMIKYAPPKMCIQYYFEQKSNDEFFHEINLDREILRTKSAEDVVSHLYVTESYYFNPKQVKRAQLVRLVTMLQQNLSHQPTLKMANTNLAQRSAQINIQDNMYQANNVSPAQVMGASQNSQDNSNASSANGVQHPSGRKKNFFERKRFISYENSGSPDRVSEQSNEAPQGEDGLRTGSPADERRRGAANANALHNRRRFDDLQIQNKAPSHSPQPQTDIPAIGSRPRPNMQQQQQLPPLKGARGAPISDPIFLNNQGHGHGNNNGGDLQQQPERANLLEIDDQQQNQQQFTDEQQNFGAAGAGGTDDNLIDVDFESGAEENQQPFNQETQQNDDHYQEGVQAVEGEAEGNGEEDEEGESVYMIDGVVMRMIQIEGEENQYLMEPNTGKIFDMNGNFIGTANTQGIDEMDTEGVSVTEPVGFNPNNNSTEESQ